MRWPWYLVMPRWAIHGSVARRLAGWAGDGLLEFEGARPAARCTNAEQAGIVNWKLRSAVRRASRAEQSDGVRLLTRARCVPNDRVPSARACGAEIGEKGMRRDDRIAVHRVGVIWRSTKHLVADRRRRHDAGIRRPHTTGSEPMIPVAPRRSLTVAILGSLASFGSGAHADPFSIPAVVQMAPLAVEIDAEKALPAAGSERFVVPLEVWRDTSDYAEFDVTAAVDGGWLAEVVDSALPATSLPVLAALEPPKAPNLALVVTRDPVRDTETPGLLRVRLDFRDREGNVGDGALLLHFANAGSVLVPITFDDYAQSLTDLAEDEDEAWRLAAVDTTTFGDPAPEVVGATTAAGEASTFSASGGEAVPMALISTRTITGTIAFWDTRPKYDQPGSRYPTCDPTLTACVAGVAGCCFSVVPAARILVSTNAENVWTDVAVGNLDMDGAFAIETDTPLDLSYLRVTVVFDASQNPDTSSFGLGDSSGVYRVNLYAKAFATGDVVDLGQLPLNRAGDTTSQNGNVGAAWASILDADRRIVEEGDTTLRSGTPLMFELTTITQRQLCDDKGRVLREYIPAAEARTRTPAWSVGFALLTRRVGCNTQNHWPNFPVRDEPTQNAFSLRTRDSDTAEGVALVPAIGELVAMLTWWDPATATWSGMKATHDYKCFLNSPGPTEGYCDARNNFIVTGTGGKPNSNNLSSYRNNAVALWNLIDASQADAYYCKQDIVALTVGELMEALVQFRNAPLGGGNGDPDEMWFVSTSTNCAFHGSAGPGDVCADPQGIPNLCGTGDPHGTNLRDWIRYLPIGDQTAALAAITSHECVGIEDHAYPFRGGFHGD